MPSLTVSQSSRDVGQDLPRNRRSHPCTRWEAGDWPNRLGTESTDRLGGLPQNVAKITTRLSSGTTKRGRSQTSVECAWMLDFQVQTRADASDVRSFSEAGPLRTCASTTVTTMGLFPVGPLLEPVDRLVARIHMMGSQPATPQTHPVVRLM